MSRQRMVPEYLCALGCGLAAGAIHYLNCLLAALLMFAL